ncbi:hypothetical protein R77569_00484 [Ralstonia mannitolilytica]|uniref:Uncharacterized protein n=1 Tax=Ralstonia mannitolilytica TaxID=105219 RepID=A0ABM9KE11_9RALS|nr:hypothetical protein R77569_00484 [Ralstonia mannitolilytica]
MEQHRDGRPDLYPAPALPAQPRRQPCHPGRPTTVADSGRSPTARSKLPPDAGHLAQGQACRSPVAALASRRSVCRHTEKPHGAPALGGGEKVGKAGILPADNTKLGIADRRYATNESKAKELGDGLARITDPYVRMSLRLRAALGLRREESIKFQPHYADRGDHIAGAADGTGRVPPAGRFGLADSGGQDLHPTAARLRWAMQGSRPEQHAGTPASVCADAV